MGKNEKLMERLKSLPKDFTFDEMQTLLTHLGFTMSNKGKTSGSRVKFVKHDLVIILHKPHPEKELRVYQVKEVLAILERNGLI